MESIAIYEQLFGHCRGVYFRMPDAFGDPVVVAGRADMVRQIGFEASEALIPNDNRLFRGFDFLRDYFAFPRRFLGFDLGDLGAVAPRLTAKTIDILFTFDEVESAPAGRGQEGDVRALCRGRRQPVQEDARPDLRQIQPARISRRAGSQPDAGL